MGAARGDRDEVAATHPADRRLAVGSSSAACSACRSPPCRSTGSICQATGYDGTPKTEGVVRSEHVTDAMVTVRFDANVNSALPWRFAPAQREVRVRLGEETLVHYTAKNTSDKPITGTATFNVVPDKAAQYFSKLECFCFTEQTLAPGEEVSMPVVFYVDPALAEDVDARDVTTLTLVVHVLPRQCRHRRAAGPNRRRRREPAQGQAASRRDEKDRRAAARRKDRGEEHGKHSSNEIPSLPHGRAQPVAGDRAPLPRCRWRSAASGSCTAARAGRRCRVSSSCSRRSSSGGATSSASRAPASTTPNRSTTACGSASCCSSPRR